MYETLLFAINANYWFQVIFYLLHLSCLCALRVMYYTHIHEFTDMREWNYDALLNGWAQQDNPSSVTLGRADYISMGWCKKDVTPLLTHWSYIFIALTQWYICSTHCSYDYHSLQEEITAWILIMMDATMQWWKALSAFNINGLVQERCNSSVLAMELHLSCTIPSTSYMPSVLMWCLLHGYQTQELHWIETWYDLWIILMYHEFSNSYFYWWWTPQCK